MIVFSRLDEEEENFFSWAWCSKECGLRDAEGVWCRKQRRCGLVEREKEEEEMERERASQSGIKERTREIWEETEGGWCGCTLAEAPRYDPTAGGAQGLSCTDAVEKTQCLEDLCIGFRRPCLAALGARPVIFVPCRSRFRADIMIGCSLALPGRLPVHGPIVVPVIGQIQRAPLFFDGGSEGADPPWPPLANGLF